MVNVSKKYLDKKLKDKIWGELLGQIKKSKSVGNFENILTQRLTPKELVILEKRLAIDHLLRVGIRHNEIKRILDVSSHTITFVKKKLQRPLKKQKKIEPISEKDLKERKSRFPTLTGKGRWRFLTVEH